MPGEKDNKEKFARRRPAAVCRKKMNCEKCGAPVKQTLSDNSVSKIGRYVKAAYYCDACDEIFILDKYKAIRDAHQYDGELAWLRAQNPRLQTPD